MTIDAVAKVLVINDNNEVLFVRRSQSDRRRPGQLDLPGGMVESSEDLRQAAIRETYEETGIKLKSPLLVFGYSEPRLPYGYPTWVFFAEKIKKPSEIVLSSEHDDFKWIEPQAALAEITYNLHKQLIKYVIDNNLLELLPPP